MSQYTLSDFERTDWEYRDEADLRELYWERGLTLSDVGDKCGCHKSTVAEWMERFGIPRRQGGYPEQIDAAELTRLYVGRQLSMQQVADKLDVAVASVFDALDRHDIARRPKAEAMRLYADVNIDTAHAHGYEVIRSAYKNERDRVLHHRLIAVAEYGFDAVCDNHVHHTIPIPWLNFGANLEVMTPEEHRDHHMAERYSSSFSFSSVF